MISQIGKRNLNLIDKTEKELSLLEKNPKKIIFIFILSIVLAMLFVVEFILSSTLHVEKPSEKRYVYIKEIVPNTNTVGSSDQPEKKKVKIRTDKDGLLLPSKVHSNADKEVFFIGASTILTLTIEEKKRLPYLTGRILESSLGQKINSYNAAAGSASSFHGMNILINKVLPYEPDYLVFMYNTTDLTDLIVSDIKYWNNNYKTVSGAGIIDILRELKDSMFPNIYYVLKNTLNFNIGSFINNLFNSNQKVERKVRTFKDFNYVKSKERFIKNLKVIINICKAYGIKPVIMTEPYSVKGANDSKILKSRGVEDYLAIHAKFNNIIRELATKEDIILVDLAEQMTFNGNENLFVGEWHFSLKGVEKAANLIATQITDYEKSQDIK